MIQRSTEKELESLQKELEPGEEWIWILATILHEELLKTYPIQVTKTHHKNPSAFSILEQQNDRDQINESYQKLAHQSKGKSRHDQ